MTDGGKIMNLVRWCIVGLLALSISACLPVTTRLPVGSTVGFANDPGLEGAWVGKIDATDSAVTYFHFIANKDNTITVIIVGPPKQPLVNIGWQTHTLTTATLGGHHYINARPAMHDGKPISGKIVIPILYTIGKGTLTLYLLDLKKTAAAVAANGIASRSQEGDLKIIDAAKRVDALFGSADAPALFRTWTVLRKLK